jgi:phosphoribosyl 1,2-cyclic phosphate phosphodiesterase
MKMLNKVNMKITVLGCGTSTGVPVIGCPCEVCNSRNPRNRRTRASIMVSNGRKNILVDTSPDLRSQALDNGICNIDAVLYTHTHADHIFGLDELRIFNFLQGEKITLYGSEKTLSEIRTTFRYIWNPNAPVGGGKPMLETQILNGRLELSGISVEPVEILHGKQKIYGYVFETPGDSRSSGFAYLTDCSAMPDGTKERVRGKDVLILGALRYRPHPTHFSLDQALAAIEELRPERAFLTHLSHSFEYEKVNAELPGGVELAYDGMLIEL